LSPNFSCPFRIVYANGYPVVAVDPKIASRLSPVDEEVEGLVELVSLMPRCHDDVFWILAYEQSLAQIVSEDDLVHDVVKPTAIRSPSTEIGHASLQGSESELGNGLSSI